MTTINANVAAVFGANFLDNVMPDWYKKIDKRKLVMNHCCRCILGQLFGNYLTGLNILSIDENEREDAILGFHTENFMDATEEDYAELKQAWVYQIDKRLTKQQS